MSDLSKGNWKEVMKILFNNLWLNVDENVLKTIWTVSNYIRKIIKDEKTKEYLEIIDSPDFLISYAYLISWFNIWLSDTNWKDSVNSYNSFASVIMKILDKDDINISSFLCAHRENKEIEKNKLVDDVNLFEYRRVINLIKWIFENLWKKYSIDFYNIEWNAEWMNAVFPSLFLSYFEKWELFLMSNQLDNHLKRLTNDTKNEIDINIHSVSNHFKSVSKELIEKYWKNWWNKSYDELKYLWKEDLFIEKSLLTYKELWRFEKSFNDFFMKYSNSDIEKMKKLNIEKSREYNKEKIVEKAIEIFFNKSNLTWKALYETMFFYLWWNKVKEIDWIWFWFDRDHDLFQTEAFSLGYNNGNNTKNNIPLIYWRRTWKKSWNNLNDLSFRQFWHFYN